MLEIARGRARPRHLGEASQREPQDEGTRGVGNGESHMAHEGPVELGHAGLAVGVASRGHFLQDIGMATHGALAENDQAAGKDVGALHRDRHRNDLVSAAEILFRSQADALSAVHIHGVVRDHAAELG